MRQIFLPIIFLLILAPILTPALGNPLWIWGNDSIGQQTLAFRKTFEVAEFDKASVIASCDDRLSLWINGREVGKSANWQQPLVADVTEFVRSGANLIAVVAFNNDGPAAFALELEISSEGKSWTIATDTNWLVSSEPGKGWKSVAEPMGKWSPPVVIRPMGDQPWGDLFNMTLGRATVSASQVKVPEGFRVEKIHDVSPEQGSWVAVTTRDDGRLITCDQYGSLYLVTPPPLEAENASAQVEPIGVKLGGAQGLLWFQNSLYAAVNNSPDGSGTGVFHVTDSDDDGKLDQVTLLKKFTPGGEHGLHALVLSPDQQWIYFIVGNHSALEPHDFSWVPEHWDEDQLLPSLPDANGHAVGLKAPGGYIMRFRPDNSRWELVATGFRNAYDMAFTRDGSLLTYDSDMEWDFGLPWYRPTRICHAIPGGEFGWRSGSGKWPAYSEDSMGPILNVGLGSPTGMLSGRGAKFPARYQEALFAFDWTYATIYALHLQREGESLHAELENFASSEGWPLTDGTIGRDGAMYLTTGGRRVHSSLWRLSYVGNEATDPVPYETRESPEYSYGGKPTAELWAALARPDRSARNLARAALERRAPAEWRDLFRDEVSAQGILTGAIALTRSGEAADKELIFSKLRSLEWETLDPSQRLAALRGLGLVAIRLGGFTDEQRQELLAAFDDRVPSGDPLLDRELFRLLAYLNSPTIVAKALAEMEKNPADPAPGWFALSAHNPPYRRQVEDMLRNAPSAHGIFLALCIRQVSAPWTPTQRERYFTWLHDQGRRYGGLSYVGYLREIAEDAMSCASPEEQERIKALKFEKRDDPLNKLPAVAGPGKTYTVGDVVALAAGGLEGRNLAHGEDMFRAALCASCHRFRGLGGATGPDLSQVSGRFSVADLATAIIDPSQEISEQYAFSILTKKDGSSIVGRVLSDSGGQLQVASNPYDLGQTIRIPRDTVETIQSSPLSPMPAGLINQLNAEEVKDLLAYLLGKY